MLRADSADTTRFYVAVNLPPKFREIGTKVDPYRDLLDDHLPRNDGESTT
jgi:hypothetical protein